MPLVLYSIGHSTHSLGEFLALLARHGVKAVADIRRFPGSRKHPQFGQSEFSRSLNGAGVEYRWIESLGGRRESHGGDSPNGGLRNESFRNYADYMQTPGFERGLDELLVLARDKATAFLCSEAVYWRCHRRLVSDVLVARGHTVRHIMPDGSLRPHTLTPGLRQKGPNVTYPPVNKGDQGPTLF